MRSLHSTVALALVLLLGPTALRGTAQPPPAPAASQLMVFLRGVPAGSEDVTVSRTAGGTTIAGSARLGSPISVTVRKAEIRYGADGQALSCNVEGSIRDRLLVVVATVTETTAAWSVTEGTSSRQKTDSIDAGAVLLTPVFLGSYEALAWRLGSMKAGDTLQVLALGQGPMSAKVLGSSEERIQTLGGLVNARRSMIAIDESKGPLEMEVWGDAAGRLVRLSVPSQGLEVMRSDVATVAARQVQVSRPNDESVRVPANGFTIAATVSKPEAPALAPKAKPPRLPAVVLVGGTGETDRDETIGGVPVLGQLSSGLADAGFLVVRYDRRGIGQSGGRAETVTLPDYAEDVRAVVKYARKRKDVDSDRVAVLGYGEGGMVTLLAAAGHDDIKAVVLAAAPGVPGTEMVLEQQRRALARLNLTDADRQARIDLQKRIQQAVLTHTGWEGIHADLRNRAETPLFESRLAFDPVKTVPRTRQPMLIVHGSLDKQMDPSNAEKLASLARARKRPAGEAVKVAMLPGLNHLLVPATTGEVDEYASLPDKTVARAAVDAIAGWLRDTMPPKKR